MPYNQGYAYFAGLIPTTGFAQGRLRIASNNASATDPDYYRTYDDTRLHTPDFGSAVLATPTNIQTMQPLPEGGALRGFSSSLQLLYTQFTSGLTLTAYIQSFPYTEYLL